MQVVDVTIDLRSIRPGDKIDTPYELTLSESLCDFWQSAFHAQERIHTSTPFARRIGLQGRVVPFSLMVFLTLSMSHADSALVQVGLEKAIYHWPAFAGDTFNKSFKVKSIRNTSDGNHSVINFACELINQRKRLCMSVYKSMMFPFAVLESKTEHQFSHPETTSQLFRDHLLGKEHILHELGSHSLVPLRPNQLIYHTMSRSLTLSQTQQLASLARLTHERHFDIRKYDPYTEILVPGGLVLGSVLSATSRDLHEVLHEEIERVSFLNSLHPGNVVGAITYIASVDDSIAGDLESLQVRTLGLKNVDVVKDLQDVLLPMELFVTPNILPKDMERICKAKCPILSKKIVAVVDRKIIRQASRKEVFLL